MTTNGRFPSGMTDDSSTPSQDTLNPVEQGLRDEDEFSLYFRNHFEDYMEINADPETYARYLDRHSEWFRRCALPMQTEAIAANSYALTIGRFGAFDYYVEPKIGLELQPQDQGIYRIRTVEVPNYTPPGYEVDFQAAMHLVPVNHASRGLTTHVTWTLELGVQVWFPKFIRLLPQGLLQTTGDRLLAQIVRQVSRRLTAKVQADFHTSAGLPQP